MPIFFYFSSNHMIVLLDEIDRCSFFKSNQINFLDIKCSKVNKTLKVYKKKKKKKKKT